MNEKNEPIPREDSDAGTDWEALDSRVSTALQEIESALEEALAATRGLTQWVERLSTLSAFMRQVESGLVEVRQRLVAPPQVQRPASAPPARPELETAAGEPAAEETEPPEWAIAEAEAGAEPEPVALETAEVEGAPEAPAEAGIEPVEPEGLSEPTEAEAATEAEPMVAAPAAAGEGNDKIRLAIESSEANIDLMVVERALRETPGVADVDLLDYAGRRARLQVTLSPGERPEEVASPERLADSVRERLAKLTWDGSLSVSEAE